MLKSCDGLRPPEAIAKLFVSLLCVKRAMIAESHGSCLMYPLNAHFLSSLSGGSSEESRPLLKKKFVHCTDSFSSVNFESMNATLKPYCLVL